MDYVAVVDAETLDDVQSITDRPTLLAIAVKIENTRLIDNTILRAETIES
jgi:pantothenate synthetase